MLIIQSVEYTENSVLHKSHWYASGAHILFKQIEQSVRKRNGSVFDRQLKRCEESHDTRREGHPAEARYRQVINGGTSAHLH